MSDAGIESRVKALGDIADELSTSMADLVGAVESAKFGKIADELSTSLADLVGAVESTKGARLIADALQALAKKLQEPEPVQQAPQVTVQPNIVVQSGNQKGATFEVEIFGPDGTLKGRMKIVRKK